MIMKKVFGLIILMVFLSSFSYQFITTKLKVKVVTEQGEIVKGAKVMLFETVENYNKHENEIAYATTDEKGECKFKNLEGKAYYIIAEKGDFTNLLNSDRTKVLHQGKQNRIIVVVE